MAAEVGAREPWILPGASRGQPGPRGVGHRCPAVRQREQGCAFPSPPGGGVATSPWWGGAHCRPRVSPLQIVLPWLTTSEKVQEQARAAYTIAHMLRFVCNFPELLASAGEGRPALPPPPAPWASLPPGTPTSVPRGLAGPPPRGPTGRVLLVWSGRGGGPPRADGRWRWRGWWPGWGEAASGTTRG